MGLVNPAHRKGLHDPLVHSETPESLLIVKGALMLVDHDPILMKRVKTVPVKLFCEQPLCRPERIGGVNNDQIIGI